MIKDETLNKHGADAAIALVLELEGFLTTHENSTGLDLQLLYMDCAGQRVRTLCEKYSFIKSEP